jgi:hypothetical protein
LTNFQSKWILNSNILNFAFHSLNTIVTVTTTSVNLALSSSSCCIAVFSSNYFEVIGIVPALLRFQFLET